MVRSHRQTRSTLRLVLVLAGSAVLAAASGAERWVSLHLFLAGALVLAISGVTLMLTITWSAAPAPPDGWVALQRGCIAVGAAGVVAGRSLDAVGLAVVAGVVHLGGLAILAILLRWTIQRGVVRRFDAAVAAYLAATAFGVVGVALGLSMLIGDHARSVRSAHVVANLLGLVGITVLGTLPYFVGTVVRARMSRRATGSRLRLLLAWQVSGVCLSIGALLAGSSGLSSIGYGSFALGVLVLLALLPSPTRRQIRWAGPRMVALWLGCVWWILAVVTAALNAVSGRPELTGTTISLLVVPAYGQILWAALAYLLPMLRGGGHVRLAEGFARTRSWPGLAAVNTVGVALAVSWGSVAAFAMAGWVLDAATRFAWFTVARPRGPVGPDA